jgi:DNA repair protein RAD51
MKSFI